MFFLFRIAFFLCLIFSLQAKEKICLNMIVKDESAVIRRCLDSVKPIIDYWVIVDTGSTDGTQQIIKEHMKDIPGELHERPWKNFGANRTEALELAKAKGDYLLFMDADDWLEYEPDFKLPELTKDIYHMWRVHGSDFSYAKVELAKTTLPMKWVGVLHEYLEGGKPCTSETLEKVKYVSGSDGARSQDPEKFLKHVKLLEDGLLEEPDNSRYVFYLAESYRDAGNKTKALQNYLKRINMGGWEEEIFWSHFQAAQLMADLKLPIDLILGRLQTAHFVRPNRAEPIYVLAETYNRLGKYALAYECLKGREFLPKSNQKDILFNMDWVENYGLLYQLSISALHLGHHAEALKACNTLLAMPNLPEWCRTPTSENRLFLLNQLQSTNIEDSAANDTKSVFLTILARNKAYLLPTYLKCIESLDYNKKLITVYINTNNNEDRTEEILEAWAKNNESKYQKIIFESHQKENITDAKPHAWNSDRLKIIGEIRNESLMKAKELGSDFYFVVDCDCFIAPYTLRDLIAKDKPIVAPLLPGIPSPGEIWSTFWADVDDTGYYKDSPEYWNILKHVKLGTFKVPLVHQTYLIKSEYLDKLGYTNNTGEWEFVVFSRIARTNHVDQYVCNEKLYGVHLAIPSHLNLAEEGALFNDQLEDQIAKTLGFVPKNGDPLAGRIPNSDKRYLTFKLLLQLMEERKAKTIVETGTARHGDEHYDWSGNFTVIGAHWASAHRAFLHSVDINGEAVKVATKATFPYVNHVKITEDDSVHFLKNFKEKIDCLYLDSYDFDANDPEPSQQHHLKEIEAAYDKLTPNSIVIIDDCALPHGGKGKYVIEYLKNKGWHTLANDYQVIMVQNLVGNAAS